ncbi:MAG: hypothetical protein ACU0CI_08100 [Shimia sp.]
MSGKRKFGPTAGEYRFRLAAGIVILALIAVLIAVHGMPGGLVTSESVIFGGAFALFLVGHSAVKLWKRDHR